MAEEGHSKDALQELLDGRLDGQARARVEEHLAACEACRRETEALRLTRQAARRAFAAEPAPQVLRQQVLQALDHVDHPELKVRTQRIVHPRQRRRFIFAIGIAASALLAAALYVLTRPPQVPVAVAKDYEAYRADRIPLELRTSDPKILTQFFEVRGLSFRTRVLDLGMMKYRLIGGRVYSLRGKTSAFFVYEGPGKRIAICQMFEGSVSDLPAGATIRSRGGISMSAYKVGGTSVVFWQEGNVVCVLASDLPMEDLIELAFLKAMKV